jgi:hypothetical protein
VKTFFRDQVHMEVTAVRMAAMTVWRRHDVEPPPVRVRFKTVSNGGRSWARGEEVVLDRLADDLTLLHELVHVALRAHHDPAGHHGSRFQALLRDGAIEYFRLDGLEVDAAYGGARINGYRMDTAIRAVLGRQASACAR